MSLAMDTMEAVSTASEELRYLCTVSTRVSDECSTWRPDDITLEQFIALF